MRLLESGGKIYLDKEGRRKQCRVRKGVVMNGPEPGNSHSNAFLLDTYGNERVTSKNLGQEGRKKYSFPDGMWNFAGDLLDFFPMPELPK